MKGTRKLIRPLKIVLYVGFYLLVSLLFLEVILQIIPITIAEYPARINYTSDVALGYIPTPNQNESYYLSCVKNRHITTNKLGMRAAGSTTRATTKIALLGDSFLHGLAVPDSLHIANILSSHTGFEIWNGGDSGYGTYQELLWWKKLAKPEKPNITILFLFLENDVRDNQCKLCRAEGQVYSPCCEVENGKIKHVTEFQIRKTTSSGWKEWLKRNWRTYNLAINITNANRLQWNAEKFFQKESFAYNLYRPGYSQAWEEGWQILEWSLVQLKKECEESGSHLLVVNVPGPVQWAYNWREELRKQLKSNYIPADFDIESGQKRLESIVERNNIRMLDLTPGFIEYRNKYQLSEPVFGFCCDGHWNPIGHHLAADLVFNYLAQTGWVTTGVTRFTTQSPRNLVGAKMYEDIYGCRPITF